LWKGSQLYFSSKWTGTATVEQLLGGGNTVVHNSQPLTASGTSVGRGTSAAALTLEILQPFVAEAIAAWGETGIGRAGADALAQAEVRIADLAGDYLGMTSGHVVWIDQDAAGYGWFVDSTPWEDSEFSTPGNQGEEAGMDLLTTVAHELGHVLGLHDNHEGYEVMGAFLSSGARRLPEAEVPAPLAIDAASLPAPAATGVLRPDFLDVLLAELKPDTDASDGLVFPGDRLLLPSASPVMPPKSAGSSTPAVKTQSVETLTAAIDQAFKEWESELLDLPMIKEPALAGF
jgi:hypothetical protein